MEIKKRKKGIYEKFFKRPLDLILAIIALIFLSPVMIITAILVKIKLGSPVIFTQKRPGLNEKIFKMYKFRSMTNEKDENGKLLSDEIRLTKFGKTLRSTSLDELPELFNIIKGDMSFVGPRPLLVEYLPYYTEEERLRHLVRPGLTGLSQINGRNTLSWEARFKLDIEYVLSQSLFNDIIVLIKSVFIVFAKSDILIGDEHIMLNFDEERNEKLKNETRKQ